MAAPAQAVPPWASLPPDVLAAVDKMADFKVRNGESFEALIREKQRNDPRFAFLFDTTSPAHAYYQFRLATLYHSMPQQAPQPQVPTQAYGNPAQPFATAPHLHQLQQPYAQLPPAPMQTPMPQFLPHPAGLIPPVAGPPAAVVQHGAYYAPPMSMPAARMQLPLQQPQPAPPPPAPPLSARQCPVGFLATILRERNAKMGPGGRRPTNFKPLEDGDLPRALPSRVAPQPQVLAAVERYYAGEKPQPPKRERERERESERERERDRRERSPPRRRRADEGGPGGASLGGHDPYDRPLASAHAEMGVREDGSALGDHGQRHTGLGVAPRTANAPNDAFSAFRNRSANRYKEKLDISKANMFSAPQ